MTKFNKRKKNQAPKKVPKTRKELRKEKRLQKKENKRNYFSKSKSKSETKGQFVKSFKSLKNDNENEKIANLNSTVDDGNDSEIASDFELSDNELNEKMKKLSKTKNQKQSEQQSPLIMDRLHEDQRREKKKQNELERKMRKQRIKQLKAANEEEDKVIRRLEKKLKIDKHKNDNTVHKMFSGDGLDYALELCLPENIEKMYTAAKEASALEDNEENDFEEDMAFALNRGDLNKDAKESELKKKKVKEEKSDSNDKKKDKEIKLRKIENKYFKDEFDMELDNESDDAIEEGSDDYSDSELQDDIVSRSSLNDDQPNKESETEEEKNDGNSEVSESQEDDDDDDLEDEHDSNDIDREEQEESFNEGDTEENEIMSDKDRIWEDIYGRKRDKDGNIIKEESSQKYIPPHVRRNTALATVDEECDSKRREKLLNLRRSCKGFLNRLAESNMHKISSEIENLYMKNSRHDMNNTLCNLIIEALLIHVLSKERLVLEHTMLIAILHANIGSEIGAHFLQVLITKFDEMLKNLNEIEVEDKELDNVVFVLSHLYTFKIFHHNLIFEIINKLIENLSEKSVECLLLMLRSIGFQLRKDDPGALKELILTIQKKAAEAPLEVKENPRLKFMLDILSAIKNNNMNKIPNYDPTLAEHLKKVLKSMLVNGKYIATLNITLDDLLNVDEKGKWWVVGSAWSGNIKDIGPANKSLKKDEKQEMFSEKLLELARKQRMNTEDRKNVFCILMSAEDYLDAFEKLLHLSIKDHRIISSILIHCCLSEKYFNPYYAVLGQKFCEYDRKYQLAIQFSSWDRIKDIHSLTKVQVQNLAQFLIHLIINGGLPISALKIVDFAELDKFTLRLVRQIVLGILLAKEDECRQVFERIAPSVKLNMFKDSIRLFMHHFLLKDCKKSNISSEQRELLKSRIGIVDKILEYTGSKVEF